MPTWIRLRGFVAAVLVLVGVIFAPDRIANAVGEQCQQAPHFLYAVRSDNGHLVELDYCDGPGFFLQREISDLDWRQYVQIIPGGQGVVYAVTRAGTLLWRKQGGSDGLLGSAITVSTSIFSAPVDWSRYVLVATGNGYLVGVSGKAEVFRHVNWTVGGTTVTQEQSLFPAEARPLSYLHSGSFAEALNHGMHIRVWAGNQVPVLFASGPLPGGISSVTGGEPALFGVDGGGSVVRLRQEIHYVQDPSGNLVSCPLYELAAWQIAEALTGSYQSVFAAPYDTPSGVPTVQPLPSASLACEETPNPYEWQ